METYQQILSICLETTKQLLQFAEESQWDQLEAGLKKRDKSLQQLLALNIVMEDSLKVRQAIEEIKKIDRRVMALAKENREKIFANLKQRKQGQKMKAAYGRTIKRY
ncbi:flagellar protein FliT [Motiliproteus sp. MSK22-1]|uniref:flagellar protein FliT n=1 Tax=Motiliproteus sp. MSK22-1 TaxID=1897630 RepID=UPI00097618F1|nr:flagellar protein FliT [Motiliproteus sp. MSK22-1]OMH30011.1 hypothetical protein BGP75_18960 [Motiliproteus sp. MSK22-1]